MIAIRIATTGLDDTDEIIGISIFDDREGSIFREMPSTSVFSGVISHLLAEGFLSLR